jgi:hypothetical protein
MPGNYQCFLALVARKGVSWQKKRVSWHCRHRVAVHANKSRPAAETLLRPGLEMAEETVFIYRMPRNSRAPGRFWAMHRLDLDFEAG